MIGKFKIELTSARNVNMTRRLVRTGIKTESNHHSTTILGSANVVPTISEGQVGVVELLGKLVVNGDAMSKNSQRRDVRSTNFDSGCRINGSVFYESTRR